ncbi:MAG: ABC transporter permease, partial [Thermomicrobiales bacterium]
MGTYVLGRLLQFVPTLFVVSVVVFLMVRAIPGDAAYALLGPTAKPEQIAALRAEMGLDEPLWKQYLVWIEGVVRGDLGRSWINDFPVAELIRQKLPATVALAVGSMAIALFIAIPMGILPALRPGSWIARAAALYNGLMLAIPTFWLGVLLVLVVSLRFGWLPPSGYVPFREDPLQSLKLLILPSFTLGAYLSAIFARFLYTAINESLS